MKIKVYIMHSDKINYKDDLYKPLLEHGLMHDYFLILPMSNSFIDKFAKDLINESDIVICNLSNSNFLLNVEMKWAISQNKDIYYFIKNDDKKISKFKNYKYNVYSTTDELINQIIALLKAVNQKELILKRDNIFCLGKLENVKKKTS